MEKVTQDLSKDVRNEFSHPGFTVPQWRLNIQYHFIDKNAQIGQKSFYSKKSFS